MSRYNGSPDFRHGGHVRTGILLINLGTPAAPTTAAVRRYLREFLSDPRVVELPRWLWLPLLNGVILNVRPRRSARAYAEIWRDDGSPLLRLSEGLRDALRATLGADDADIVCELGMRYGEPAVADAIDRLLAGGARRILVLPLYPQYASATTASALDVVFAHLSRLRWMPEVRCITDYHDHPAYIAALAASVRRHWEEHGRGERLLLSFHGIPRDTFIAGDPYFCQCQATARLLAADLGLAADACRVSFQSRVGPKAWLEPYTEQTLAAWGADGIGDIDVLCPGFAVDCLETLEEIALRNAADFRAAGGGSLRYIPALNDSDEHAGAIAALLRPHLEHWHERSDAAAQRAAAERAIALGADD